MSDAARKIAAAFLVRWNVRSMTANARSTLELDRDEGAWLGMLARQMRRTYRSAPPIEWLVRSIENDSTFKEEWRIVEVFRSKPAMGPRRFESVPEIASEAALAKWLGLDLPDLDWFADLKGFRVREPFGRLHHYRYHLIRKSSGKPRLIEAPKEMLKELQRRILDHLLVHVPAHEAAHGFRRGRSPLTFAAPHAGNELVLRMDLRDFFPSVSAARVTALFASLGYPRNVARFLTGIVTTRTPEAVLWEAQLGLDSEDAHRKRHLPQGAPTSPALANLVAFKLDARLDAAAKSVDATYTRYADDLAFSGGESFRRQAERFRLLVCRIVGEEGFGVRWEKNLWMSAASRQRLAGLVVNERPRPSREEFDRLKAILHNCVKQGPASQNRDGLADFEAHLRGRVAWFLQTDEARGQKLRALLEKVAF